MALDIVDRHAQATIYRDPAWTGGRYQSVLTIHDQWCKDGSGLWVAVDEALDLDGLDGFAWRLRSARHGIRLADDGKRRWYPRRNVLGEYVEFGRPEYWTGSTWELLPLGTPVRSGSTLTWDRPNYALKVSVNWRRVKLDITLKASNAARRIRWPVTLVGLQIESLPAGGWVLKSGNTVVGYVDRLTALDANDVEYPVTAAYSGGYVEFTANLTGATFPVVVDPTLDIQPDPTAGKDANVRENFSTRNYGASTSVDFNGDAGATSRSHGLISFDLSSIAASNTCDNATLHAFNYRQRDITVNIYHLIAQAWGEGAGNDSPAAAGECCWDYRIYNTDRWLGDSGGNGGSDAGGSVSGTDYEAASMGSFNMNVAVDSDISVTLTASEVQESFGGNLELYMVGPDNDNSISYGIRSSDYTTDTSKRPRLVVNYTAAGGNVTVTPTAVSCVAAKVDPTVVLGSLATTPAAVSAICAVAGPTVAIVGAVLVTAAAAAAIAAVAGPTVVLGSLGITPAAASAVAALAGPTVLIAGGVGLILTALGIHLGGGRGMRMS